MTDSILIKNGRVVDPGQGMDREANVLIVDGKISSVSAVPPKSVPHDCEVLDASGLIVTPGLIDMHCHLRDPGIAEEETIASGTMSAAAGGYTTVACMANTTPVADSPAVIEYIISKAAAEGIVNVLPVAAATKGLGGEEISEMGLLLETGAVASRRLVAARQLHALGLRDALHGARDLVDVADASDPLADLACLAHF